LAEKQYLFFKSIYDEEKARQTSLQDRAKTYLTLVTFYSAFVLFVVEKLTPIDVCTLLVFLAAMGSMGIAFLLCIWALNVSEYEALNNPEEILNEEFSKAAPSDEDFFGSRCADYTVAYTRNSAVNDKKANLVWGAGYLLLAGIVLHAVYFVSMIPPVGE
jgi:hypothetical protein